MHVFIFYKIFTLPSPVIWKTLAKLVEPLLIRSFRLTALYPSETLSARLFRPHSLIASKPTTRIVFLKVLL